MRRSGPAGTGDGIAAQTGISRKQRSSNTVRQEQQGISAVVETSASHSDDAGKRSGKDPISRSGRKGPGLARQESASQPASYETPAKGGGSIAPPGPTGTRRGSRDRSPSPARQGQPGDSVLGGVVGKSGVSSIHSGVAGTGSSFSAQTPVTKQRSSSPVRQESGAASASAGTVVDGKKSAVHPGPAGTGGSMSVRTDFKSKQRGPDSAQQKAGKGPAPSSASAKGGGPITRPGPAGIAAGPEDQTRTTKTPPGKPGIGGPEHGKPKR